MVNSKWVNEELDLALQINKTILPVKIDDSPVPEKIRNLKHIYTKGDYDEALKIIRRSIRWAVRKPEIVREEIPSKHTIKREKSEKQSYKVPSKACGLSIAGTHRFGYRAAREFGYLSKKDVYSAINKQLKQEWAQDGKADPFGKICQDMNILSKQQLDTIIDATLM